MVACAVGQVSSDAHEAHLQAHATILRLEADLLDAQTHAQTLTHAHVPTQSHAMPSQARQPSRSPSLQSSSKVKTSPPTSSTPPAISNSSKSPLELRSSLSARHTDQTPTPTNISPQRTPRAPHLPEPLFTSAAPIAASLTSNDSGTLILPRAFVCVSVRCLVSPAHICSFEPRVFFWSGRALFCSSTFPDRFAMNRELQQPPPLRPPLSTNPPPRSGRRGRPRAPHRVTQHQRPWSQSRMPRYNPCTRCVVQLFLFMGYG
jgi:hypothetical protein